MLYILKLSPWQLSRQTADNICENVDNIIQSDEENVLGLASMSFMFLKMHFRMHYFIFPISCIAYWLGCLYLFSRHLRQAGEGGTKVRDVAHLRHGQFVLKKKHRHEGESWCHTMLHWCVRRSFKLPVWVWPSGPVWPDKPPVSAPSSWAEARSSSRKDRRSLRPLSTQDTPRWTWKGRGRCQRLWSRSSWRGSPTLPLPPPGRHKNLPL